MDVKIVILSEVSQTEKELSSEVVHMQNPSKTDRDDIIHEAERYSQTLKTHIWLLNCKGGGQG